MNNNKKRKQDDSNSNVVETIEQPLVEKQRVKTYYILHRRCSDSRDECKDPNALVNKQKIRKNIVKLKEQDKKELHAQIKKKSQKFVKNKKRRKTKEDHQNYQELEISDNESENQSISSVADSIENREILSSSSKCTLDLGR